MPELPGDTVTTLLGENSAVIPGARPSTYRVTLAVEVPTDLTLIVVLPWLPWSTGGRYGGDGFRIKVVSLPLMVNGLESYT